MTHSLIAESTSAKLGRVVSLLARLAVVLARFALDVLALLLTFTVAAVTVLIGLVPVIVKAAILAVCRRNQVLPPHLSQSSLSRPIYGGDFAQKAFSPTGC